MTSSIFYTGINLTDVRGIEFQLRDHKSQPESTVREIGDVTYPLPFADRLRQGERFLRDTEEFDSSIKSIGERYSKTSNDTLPKHAEGPACPRCERRKGEIWRVYRTFFLGEEDSTWHRGLKEYREKMGVLLKDVHDFNLETVEKIQELFTSELSKHIKKDFCTPQSGDSEEVKSIKKEAAEQISASTSLQTALQIATSAQLSTLPFLHPDAVRALKALQESKAPDFAAVFQGYYCDNSITDTPQQRSIKSKYASLFNKGESHHEILAKWRKEALETQEKETEALKRQLAELQLAQSAHLKNKARKAEKKQDREAEVEVEKKTAYCALRSCEKEIDLLAGNGTLECMVCDWMAGKNFEEGSVGKREHVYYCSEEHVEEHFVSFFLCLRDWNCESEG